jgi:phospholipid N-methyltransferase
MYKAGKQRRGLTQRIRNAMQVLLAHDDTYGLEWGDPDASPPLNYVRKHFLKPYATSNSTVVEIGPGGGRWTRYMLDAKQIYAVDYHQELLDELKTRFDAKNILCIKNSGDDFPGVPDGSVDFLFSFGVFVHLDIDIINRYLRNIRPLLKQDSNVVIQYSDKTKPLAKENKSFSENDPAKMRRLVLSHGYEIKEEDTKTLWHSSIVRIGLPNTIT